MAIAIAITIAATAAAIGPAVVVVAMATIMALALALAIFLNICADTNKIKCIVVPSTAFRSALNFFGLDVE